MENQDKKELVEEARNVAETHRNLSRAFSVSGNSTPEGYTHSMIASAFDQFASGLEEKE
jgi:hypothetical protein